MKILFVLGGMLVQDERGQWHTVDFGKGIKLSGETCDRWRVLAAYEWYKKNPDRLIIVSGGRGQLDTVLSQDITIASMMKKELLALGVPKQSVLIEDKTGTTYQQLQVLPDFVGRYNIGEVVIITNRWHLPRVRVMYEHAPLSKEVKKLSITFIDAESILEEADTLYWKPKIAEAYAS